MIDDSLSDVQLQDEVDKINAAYGGVIIGVKGSCGKSHPSVKHWQECQACAQIDSRNSSVGKKIGIVGAEKLLAPSVFEVEVWNKAIDAAADKASEHKVGPYYFISNEIRKLKK